MATDLKKIADQLVALSVLEVNELKNILKDEHGIEPAAAAVAVAGPAAGGDDAPAEDAKSEYDVTLKDAGAQSVFRGHHDPVHRHRYLDANLPDPQVLSLRQSRYRNLFAAPISQ